MREEVATAEQAALTTNALTTNALTTNALTTNALTTNALTTNALTANALTTNALTANALVDPAAREVLKYIVSCAAPLGVHMDLTVGGEVHGYDGQLGLAPNWAKEGGSCDSACKQWVSGCVLARLNDKGVSVPISMRGTNNALRSMASERDAFPVLDGTYYGDIFSVPQLRYACLPPSGGGLQRVCGPSIDGCVVTVPGMCHEACDGVNVDGSYPNCRDLPKDTPGAVAYSGSVTVFLQ